MDSEPYGTDVISVPETKTVPYGNGKPEQRSFERPKYAVASLFAGIGGIDLGFKQAGAEIVYANEIDRYAVETYRHAFGGAPYLDPGDIYEKHVPKDRRIDIVVGGFPCQAFSVAGFRKGFEDDRGVLYTQVLRIVNETCPKAVFLENVKNLKNHDNGRTYSIIKESIEGAGYVVDERVLNSLEYGNVPQNRERIYVVGFREDVPGSGRSRVMDAFEFPEPVGLTDTIFKIIDRSVKQDERYYYPHAHKIYPILDGAMDDPDTVYQWRRNYVRKNMSGVCPTLTAAMGGGGHNVPIIRDEYDIRKLTPQECLLIQGFPKDYTFPENMADSHKYKQVGNSVTVPVVKRIAENMIGAMRTAEEGSAPSTN